MINAVIAKLQNEIGALVVKVAFLQSQLEAALAGLNALKEVKEKAVDGE